MEAVVDPTYAVMGNLPRHHFIHCPLNDLPVRTLHQYALSQELTEVNRIPGHRPVPGRRAKINAKIIFRRSFRAMLAAHMAGFCMGGNFTGQNFAIDNQLFVKLLNIQLINFTKEEGEKDYFRFIYTLLHEVFAREPIPPEVVRWLHLIGKGIQGYEYVISYHNSMMEYHQAITSHMSLYMIFVRLERTNPRLHWQIIAWLPQYNGWKDGNHRCINALMRKTRRHVEPKTGKELNYPNDIRGVLKLVRHCWQHKARFYEEILTLIVGVDFPWLLADFQETMFDAAQLAQLNLESTME
uniref:Uncharacterized protein n=1 Tax=Arundo donax TaxID=35708 RepID=A0A0A8Y3V6_ARUDO